MQFRYVLTSFPSVSRDSLSINCTFEPLIHFPHLLNFYIHCLCFLKITFSPNGILPILVDPPRLLLVGDFAEYVLPLTYLISRLNHLFSSSHYIHERVLELRNVTSYLP